MKNYLLSALFLCLYSVSVSGQCDAQKICAEEVLTGDISTVSPIVNDCFDEQNTSIFFFTTNNSTTNSGGVDIDVNGIDCLDALNNDSITVSVVELINSNGNPCDPGNWGNNLGCIGGDSDILFNVPDSDLSTNSGYAILVGNDQMAGNLDCGFEIEISGDWVDIDACCDANIIVGDLVTVNGTGSDNGYHWTADPNADFDNPNIQDPTIGALETTIITVEGEIDGCDLTDQITLFVQPPVKVLNTFTPNGDGVNETFEIVGIHRFPNAAVTVFDRWGQQLFKSIGYTRVWDGTNKGKQLPPATYYYVIELNSLDVEIPPITGWVAIIY